MTKLIIGLLAAVLLGAIALAVWVFIAFGGPLGQKSTAVSGDQSLINVKKSGQLRICTDGSELPWAQIDPKTAEATGAEIELGQQLSKQLGVKATFVNKSFDSLIDNLIQNQCDVIMAGMTINNDRLQKISFSSPYFTNGQTLLIRKTDEKKIHSISDMKGKVVGVLGDSTSAQYAATLAASGQIREVKTYTSSDANYYDDLGKGVIDGVIYDAVGNYWYYQNHQSAVTFLPQQLTQENYGIGIRNDDHALLSEINDHLAAMFQSPDFKSTITKWYGVTP